MKNFSKHKKWDPRELPINTDGARESVRPHRSYIDNEYFTKGYASFFPHSTTVVYLILSKFANHETQVCFPAYATVMALAGITNRNTYSRDIQLLKEYGLIRVGSGSRGRVPNVYVLINHGDWKEINSDNFDTVIKRFKRKTTVSPKTPQPYQRDSINSVTFDTENHINNSEENFEITSNFQLRGKQILQRLLPSAASVVNLYFREEDVIKTLAEIGAGGSSKLIDTKTIIKALKANGCKPIKPLPSFINYE
jgi:hypothetical protein